MLSLTGRTLLFKRASDGLFGTFR